LRDGNSEQYVPGIQ